MKGDKSRTAIFAAMPPCMGGWCRIRKSCEHYVKASDLGPVDRLCDAGDDGRIAGYPVIKHRAIGTWERNRVPALLRPAQPFDGLGLPC